MPASLRITRKRQNSRLSFLKALVWVQFNMIAFLEGILTEALPTQIVVNVQGVGYQVMIPVSSFATAASTRRIR